MLLLLKEFCCQLGEEVCTQKPDWHYQNVQPPERIHADLDEREVALQRGPVQRREAALVLRLEAQRRAHREQEAREVSAVRRPARPVDQGAM